ncbi:uncharacterized protein BYT42DRAFT_6611 [Radiomyces spectabilis]|uniref:uncharacterized protein n=1 Tax=Radiomyces spectabilis TaxID=64574 RepID=UPI0022200939|nr:uncharacterized protein BYT42DRAFT_6611 [Radiomyces spectabilis]KAI8393442.1 hypothetical protein BYT42DRAFT_6611 [Radiomyces spectabilis]
MTDPLFRTVASLCVRQHQIADDGHGCCGRMYSIITDKRIVANGFGLRWRIETNPSELILQVTSIASINDQYSSYDLMQLLRLISANGGHQSLEQVRPKKVLVYLEQLAKDKAEKYTHKLATDKDVSTAGEMLERLAWQEKDNFRIGIDTGDAVVACQLFQ